MTQARSWCDRLQAQLMAAIDAIWASVEGVDDPAVLRRARDKVRLCGELSATARKVVAMTPPPRPMRVSEPEPVVEPEPQPARALHRLKGGRRGRL